MRLRELLFTNLLFVLIFFCRTQQFYMETHIGGSACSGQETQTILSAVSREKVRTGGTPLLKGFGNCSYANILKKVFSSTTRLIYTAGLEHSGHHLWMDGIIPLLLPANKQHYFPLYESNSCDDLTYTSKKFRNFLEGMSNINFLISCSYPCFKSCDKILLRPNLVYLARAAELSNLDLRIVVLSRPPGFFLHGCNRERGNVLLKQCQELVLQLTHLESTFFQCSRYYEEIGEMTNFLGVNASDAWHRSFKPHRSIEPKCEYDMPLRACAQKLDEIGRCSAKRPVR